MPDIFIVISFLELLCGIVQLAEGFVLLVLRRNEEGVIEVDDVAVGTIVGLQWLFVDGMTWRKLLLDIVEQSPVARTPTIDALLHVSHDEVGRILVAHRLQEENLEVLPLHCTRILELIDHHVLQLRTYFLEDEWGVAVLYQ